MQRNYLRFYVPEDRQHDGKPLSEWLLEAARNAGIEGGAALSRERTVEVEFFVDPDKAAALLALVKRDGLQLFYAVVPS